MGCQQLSPPIIQALFSRSTDDLDRWKQSLIEQNTALTGVPNGFLYGGTFYTDLNKKAAIKANKRLIASELRPEAAKFVDAQQILEKEMRQVEKGLTMILRDCSTEQDARDMLPTCITRLSPELSKLFRTRPEGFLYADTPLKMVQFDIIKNLLEFHASTQLL